MGSIKWQGNKALTNIGTVIINIVIHVLESYDVQKMEFSIHFDKGEVGMNNTSSDLFWANWIVEISKLIIYNIIFNLVWEVNTRVEFFKN